ncbi:MAG: isoamylase early set domain-containing protein [Bacteroidia bacterium]
MSIKKSFQKNGLTCKVTFRLPADLVKNAEKVCLVGDFNEWQKDELPLKKLKSGDFSITLSLKQGQAYQFRYLINGENWINDPEADKYASAPYPGTENSVLLL